MSRKVLACAAALAVLVAAPAQARPEKIKLPALRSTSLRRAMIPRRTSATPMVYFLHAYSVGKKAYDREVFEGGHGNGVNARIRSDLLPRFRPALG